MKFFLGFLLCKETKLLFLQPISGAKFFVFRDFSHDAG